MSFNRTSWLLFVGLLLFAVTSSAGMVEDIQSKDKAKKEKAVREFVAHPEKYKTEMSAYIKSMTEKGKLPPEAILYAVGFTMDKDYFPYIYKMLAFDEIESECIYSCAPVFAAVLTSKKEVPQKTLQETVGVGDFKIEMETHIKKECASSLPEWRLSKMVEYRSIKEYTEMAKMNFAQLLRIARNEKTPHLKRYYSLEIIMEGERGKNMSDATDMLILLLQSKNDDSDGIHGTIHFALMSLLFKLENKKSSKGFCD